MALELYTHPMSPCAQKVRIVLTEKDLEWHKVHVLEKTQLLHITPGPNGDHRPL